MHLWSDYEGKTIAGAYPLGGLIRPEGRSAFFSTSNGTGVPAVIRLTESLNDEGEMLERWRQVSEVGQENLIAIKSFGQTTFEGTHLTYALLELSDASLDDILQERPLTAAETHDVAVSLVAALSALHDAGLVHEHIEPVNVLAVGEVIKLRSDCVRECILNPEDDTPAHCAELKARDVHDLALLLLRALTLEKKLTPAIKLPAPFDKIVANGIDGRWGLAEIHAALHPTVAKPLVPESVMAAVSVPVVPVLPAAVEPEAAGPALHVRRVTNSVEPVRRPMVVGAALGVGALVLILLVWQMFRGKPAAAPVTTAPVVASAPVAAPAAHVAVAKPSAAKPSAATESVVHMAPATSATQAGWHVIAYTYNKEDQAWHKVATIRAEHPGLSPEVFAPSGHAPYLVALGGAMSEGEAAAMLQRARRDGLARDTFMRRYGVR